MTKKQAAGLHVTYALNVLLHLGFEVEMTAVFPDGVLYTVQATEHEMVYLLRLAGVRQILTLQWRRGRYYTSSYTAW